MPKRAHQPSRPAALWKFIAVGAFVVFMGLTTTLTAHAQIGGDLLPPLPIGSGSPPPEPSPSSSPTTVTEIPSGGGVPTPVSSTVGGLNGGNVPDPNSLVPGGAAPPPSGDPTGNNGGAITIPPDDGTDGSGSGTTSGPPHARPTIGATLNLKNATSKKKTSGSGGSSPSTRDGSEAAHSYGAVARRAAVSAAGRAIDLAGPLAAPVLVAVAMLLLLAVLGRGSERFGKLENLTVTRAYRL